MPRAATSVTISTCTRAARNLAMWILRAACREPVGGFVGEHGAGCAAVEELRGHTAKLREACLRAHAAYAAAQHAATCRRRRLAWSMLPWTQAASIPSFSSRACRNSTWCRVAAVGGTGKQ